MKQETLIQARSSCSPFLLERSAAQRESQQQASREEDEAPVFNHSNMPRDSNGLPKKESFLPLEAFDPAGESDPGELVEWYRDQTNGRCHARSWWAYQDGRAPELRPCEVLGYDEDE